MKNAIAGKRSEHYGLRSLGVVLLLAVALLLGATILLLNRDHTLTWSAARDSTKGLATALQASLSGLLAQSVASVAGIDQDLRRMAPGGHSSSEVEEALRRAVRFDPLSAFLGVQRGPSDDMNVVDRQGQAVAPEVMQALRSKFREIGRASSSSIELHHLFQLPSDDEWYLPVVLPLSGATESSGVVFALVAASRLMAGANGLHPASDASVALVTRDGRRLVRYREQIRSLEFGGPDVRPEALAAAMRSDTGNIQTYNNLNGQEVLYGFARSATVPLFVLVGIPVDSLNGHWLR